MMHDMSGRIIALARAPGAVRIRRGDRGSATVSAVAAMTVLAFVFAVLLTMTQVVAVRHRAGGAADLAALAAADHWSEGRAAACATARRVVEAQEARIVRCAVLGQISDVIAAADFGPFSPESRARAGPAGPPSTAPSTG
jgi:secretion/DNA translocation related TadE-like protein